MVPANCQSIELTVCILFNNNNFDSCQYDPSTLAHEIPENQASSHGRGSSVLQISAPPRLPERTIEDCDPPEITHVNGIDTKVPCYFFQQLSQ